MVPENPASPRGWKLWLILALPAILGLVLRIAAAQGDYWADEAWSAALGREGAGPFDTLFALGHGQDHLLASVWLNLVGWGNDPLIGRAPSILFGTASVLVAGVIGARRGPVAAGMTALLFAVSPTLVTYGSEASGHAAMLLVLLAATRLVDEDLAGAPVRRVGTRLTLLALFGMVAHGAMLFGVVALAGWMLTIEAGRRPFGEAITTTLHAMGGALIAVAMPSLLVGTGDPSAPVGPHDATPADWLDLIDAIAGGLAFAIGLPLLAGPLLLLALLLLPVALRRNTPITDRRPFYLLAIIGVPALAALLAPGTADHPADHLPAMMALLLLLGDLFAALAMRRKPAGPLLFGMLAATCLIADGAIVESRRGNPGGAVDAMIRRAPGGAAVMIERDHDRAVLESAAARRVYQLFVVDHCSAAPFLYASNDEGSGFPLAALRCGATFRPVAGGRAYGLSGTDWQLYERVPR